MENVGAVHSSSGPVRFWNNGVLLAEFSASEFRYFEIMEPSSDDLEHVADAIDEELEFLLTEILSLDTDDLEYVADTIIDEMEFRGEPAAATVVGDYNVYGFGRAASSHSFHS